MKAEYLPFTRALKLHVVTDPGVIPVLVNGAEFLTAIGAFGMFFEMIVIIEDSRFFIFRSEGMIVTAIGSAGKADYLLFAIHVSRVVVLPAHVVYIEFAWPERFVSPECFFL